jgi:hypothetical protein
MKRRRRVFFTSGMILLATLFVTTSAGCSNNFITSQDGQISSTPSAVASNSPAAPAYSTPAPSQTLFPEPSVKPTALPTSAKWNPYESSWYDSDWVELDPVTHRYKAVPRTPPPGYTPPKVASMTKDQWIASHQDSTDNIDIALITYYKALIEYVEKNELYITERSNWEVGQGEGGPLTILTDLGISNLQRLIDRVQWENPLVVNLEIAVCRLCRANSSNIGFTEKQVEGWRQEFATKIVIANSEVNQIALALKSGSPDEKLITYRMGKLGILALPEVYELVINQGNTDLIKYLPDILPLDKMKTYNIQAGQMDDEMLKEALRSCSDDIKIIQTLHVD